MISFNAQDKASISGRGEIYTGWSKWQLDKREHPDWFNELFKDRKIRILYKDEVLIRTIVGVEHYANFQLNVGHPIGFLVK